MASSSSFARSSQLPQQKYDVFLSFRGEDTRRTFTGHLYEGLKNRGIFTFQDDKRLEHGDSISEELLKAIEDSQVSLVIFSKNYATSSWCLNELVKIMECKDKNGQTVIPVFYDVDPSHVRKQTKSFAEAFAKHELKYKDDVEGKKKVQGWRIALIAAADLKGYDVRDRIESDCIQHIVEQVSSKLCNTSVGYLENIVGINAHLEKVKSLLEMEIDDVRIVGIWGMGGIGKTTIARAIFDTLCYQFEAACFIADIKENNCGMHFLQKILLSELLREKDIQVNNKEDGKHMIARRLRFKKVLVVLDDIDNEDHLEYLAGNLDWYGNGSRIIATTRDKHLIGKNDVVYEVTTLLDNDAIKLFNQHAFKGEVPGECFEKLSLEVVSHANGLPLALKVWGAFLHKRDITEWRSAIEQMRTNSNSKIVEKLKISYDGLESIQRDIFLDIACFLRGRQKDEIMPILESCYSGVDIRLSVLIDKSLVFISIFGTIQMHDLIQDMGKYIVKMQKDPSDRSRIWDAEDFKEVMINNTESMAVEAIWFTSFEQLSFNKEAMKNMTRLRMLCIRYKYEDSSLSESNCDDGSIEYLPNNLRWFVWHDYPCKSLPENFKPQRLVHLDLQCSSLHHLWNETKLLPCLKTLDLSLSMGLIVTPNFTKMPTLEYLYLSDCTRLEEVHPSLGCCRKLKRLKLDGCTRLVRFLYVNGESLEYLDLNFCYSLEKFPEILGITNLKLKIEMAGCRGIRELPSSFFQHQTHLTKLDLKDNFGYDDDLEYSNIVSLPSSICMLKDLVTLDVSEWRKLETLPVEIGDLENLEELNAKSTPILQPPSSIVRLNKLKVLDFSKDSNSKNFVFPRLNGGLRSLEKLHLSYCNLIEGGLPEDIGCLSTLKELNLTGNNFEHLPQSIAQLGALRSLNLSYCERLKEWPEFMRMPNMEKLDLSFCNLINGGLPEHIGCLSTLKELNLSGNKFEHLPRSIAQLGALQSLNLSYCERLKEWPEFMRMPNLEKLDLSYCNLIDGGLPEHIGCLSILKELNLRGNNFEHLPQSIGCLSSLKELNLRGNNFEHLPQSIAQLGALRSLELSSCEGLKDLPEFPEQLDTIEADWSNDWICNSLFQNISSLQHDISAFDSFSLRVFNSMIWVWENLKIPSWFHHRGSGTSISVNLPENWYISDNFLGFAVCYFGKLIDITAHLIPLCDDAMSSMTQKLPLSNHFERRFGLNFFFVPLSGLWDTSKANGRTPNDYGCIRFSFSGFMEEFGLRLLYKDESAEHCIGIKRSRDDDSEHHDEASSSSCNDESTEHHDEASSSSSKKQRSQVEVPVTSKMSQLFPTSPGF